MSDTPVTQLILGKPVGMACAVAVLVEHECLAGEGTQDRGWQGQQECEE